MDFDVRNIVVQMDSFENVLETHLLACI